MRKRTMQSVIILFGLFLGLFCNARELHFSHLTFKEGFSNNFVSFIANDNKGFFLNVANKRLFFYNNRTFLNKIVCLADNRCNYYIICNVPDKTDSFLRNHRLTLFMIFVVLLIVLLYFTLKINDLLKKKGKLESKLNERTRELDEFKVVIEEKNEEVSHQKEEIIAQAKIIESTNHVLIEQKKLITTQNVELFKHRNKLESLVEERTQELEEAKINAEESDKLKSAFLSNMSHEIRTPMNAILGFSSLLRDKNLSAIEKEEMIEIITSNSKYLLELLNDVLDLSKIQASQMELNHYNVNLHDLMIELYENFTSEAERKNLKLILSIDKISKNFIINTDKIRIKQVLTNLLLNALKYTNIGSIEFGIYDFNNEIVFFVKDTGIGIPSYTGNTIFEHFIKLEDKTKLQSGTGLGLAICKNLVELWGGRIWYESEPDKGSTFYFSHPVLTNSKKPTLQVSQQTTTNMPELSGKIILIAEDQENNFKLLEAYLVKTNAIIVWVKNGNEAINYVKNNHVDLVLMDIKMPDIDGIIATRHIKLIKPELHVIAQTAYAFEDEIIEYMESGISAYLVKPIQKNDLLQVINKYI